jgi:hypothetical protein
LSLQKEQNRTTQLLTLGIAEPAPTNPASVPGARAFPVVGLGGFARVAVHGLDPADGSRHGRVRYIVIVGTGP